MRRSRNGIDADGAAAAVAFGLVTSRRNRVTITKLGHLVAGGDRAALATAFLNAELYWKIFNEYRGNTLPADALTGIIKRYGVPVFPTVESAVAEYPLTPPEKLEES